MNNDFNEGTVKGISQEASGKSISLKPASYVWMSESVILAIKPDPFVVVSIMASCLTTNVLSAVKCTSISIISEPISTAFFAASIVLPGTRARPPRWAMTDTPES